MNPYYYVVSVNGMLLIFSIIFYFFQPKKINAIYGYRTNKAMQNLEVWNFANSFFAKQFLIYAAISFVGAMVLASITTVITWQPMAILLLSLAVSVIKTEQEINKNYDAEGKKIK